MARKESDATGKRKTAASRGAERKPRVAKAATPKPELADVRAQIDGIDHQIQALIAERAKWAHQVGKAKGKLAAAVDYYRPEREAQVLRQVVDRNEDHSATKRWCGCSAKSCRPAWPSRNR